MSTPREMRAGVPQGSVLFPTSYNMYINDASQTRHLSVRDRSKGGFCCQTTPGQQPGVSAGILI
jgi:hypothetical protein